MGRPENEYANRLAWIRATQGKLRLQEVYGIDEVVTTESGESAPLFQALLSGRSLDKECPSRIEASRPSATLYPQGFSADRLVEVIEAEIVWKAIG